MDEPAQRRRPGGGSRPHVPSNGPSLDRRLDESVERLLAAWCLRRVAPPGVDARRLIRAIAQSVVLLPEEKLRLVKSLPELSEAKCRDVLAALDGAELKFRDIAAESAEGAEAVETLQRKAVAGWLTIMDALLAATAEA